MKEEINLFWYKYKAGNGNFGDELSPYIVSKLSGKQTKYINIDYFDKYILSTVLKLTFYLIKGRMSVNEYLNYLYLRVFKHPNVLVAIGSILHSVKYKNYTIWGSGIISRNTSFVNSDFRAVRGKRTQERIRELGYSAPDAIGDPALLLPLIYSPKINRRYKIGIIPHHYHYKEFKYISSNCIKVINLLDPLEKVIDDICSCDLTLSTSLHGIIVSHSYGIDSAWFTNKSNKLYGDDIKFDDYFSSLNIEIYTPIDINLITENLEQNMELISGIRKDQLLPSKEELHRVQRDLLISFPKNLKEEYEKMKVLFSDK